jgi:hypothetical protein
MAAGLGIEPRVFWFRARRVANYTTRQRSSHYTLVVAQKLRYANAEIPVMCSPMISR